MQITKCLTTIENLKRVSRVELKPMQLETQRNLNNKFVIWSNLYGDIQQSLRGRVIELRQLLNIMSADMFLGVPFNIASYSLLTHMVAKVVGLEVGEFIWTGGDCHIYYTHLGQVTEQLSREERELPQLSVRVKDSIFDYELDDFILGGYNPHPAIKAEVAV